MKHCIQIQAESETSRNVNQESIWDSLSTVFIKQAKQNRDLLQKSSKKSLESISQVNRLDLEQEENDESVSFVKDYMTQMEGAN